MVAMVALQVLTTQGSQIGWTNPITLGLGAIVVVVGVMFFRVESAARNPFVNFGLFRNPTYTGATISNFLLNGVAGILLVSMMLVQVGGGMSAQQAGMLTLGYAIAIVAFIRVGEKLLQRFGARKPMIWGSLIVGLSIVLLMPTNLLIGQYKILAVVAYTLFGSGAGVLRDAFDRCRAVEPARRSGGIGLRHLQDGVVARCVVWRGDFRRDLHRAERQRRLGPVAERRDHLCRPSGQPRDPPGGALCAGLQPADGRGGDRLDHADGAERPRRWKEAHRASESSAALGKEETAMNAIVKEFEARLETIKAWRHHLHQHPELSFEEVNTSRYIADLVKSWGYDVVEGIGKHGVVASMTVGDGTEVDRAARRHRRPADPGGQRPAVQERGRGCLASVRPRRTLDDAAGGGRIPGSDAKLQRAPFG